MNTFEIEDSLYAPFIRRIPMSIERGQGVYVWDKNGKKYIDFTSGWGVTSIGHSNPIIINALTGQAGRII
jgi:acetylornithine/N-succinyldiaminopimelate aminotransferase